MTSAAVPEAVPAVVPATRGSIDRFALRSLRRQPLILATVIGLCVVLVASLAWLRLRPAPAPITVPNAHGWVLDAAREGHAFTDGLELIKLSADVPFTITDVRSIGGGDGLRLVGVRVAGDKRKKQTEQYRPGFPPRARAFGPLRDPVGMTLPAQPGTRHDAWELLLGYEVTRPGIWERTAVEIDYLANGRAYTASYPSTLVVCTRRVPKARCLARFQ